MAVSMWLDAKKTPPPDGTWCWVSDGESTWIAERDEFSCGGWRNRDTWEDFDEVVAFYIPLAKPVPPGKVQS